MVCIRNCDICGKSTSVSYVKDKGLICTKCERPNKINVGGFFKEPVYQYVFDFYWDNFNEYLEDRKELDAIYKGMFDLLS